MNSKNTLFTIGQFAAFHGIPKKTLMWYDETGLFKPAVVKENGYRYYTYFQSSTLETILMLRELGVSIAEIKAFLKNRSALQLKLLLEERLAELDHTIAHLKNVRRELTMQKDRTAALLELDLTEIRIVKKKEQRLIMVSTTKDTTYETEIELVTAEAKKHRIHRFHNASYGSMIPVASLQSGNFDDYSALFLCIPNPAPGQNLHKKPGGNYLQAYCKGPWDTLAQKYRELLDYALEHHIALYGNSYETGINETAIDCMDDYITQIEIPIAEL